MLGPVLHGSAIAAARLRAVSRVMNHLGYRSAPGPVAHYARRSVLVYDVGIVRCTEEHAISTDAVSTPHMTRRRAYMMQIQSEQANDANLGTDASITHMLSRVAANSAALADDEAVILSREAEVLKRILADMTPIMRYIDSKLLASGYCPGGEHSVWRYRPMPEPGIQIVGGPDKLPDDEATRGQYGGQDLVLSRSGALIYRTFAGHWSRWDDESEYWDTGIETLSEDDAANLYGYDDDSMGGSTTLVTARDALGHYGLEEILQGVLHTLQDAYDRVKTRRTVLDGRLQRLKAIVAAMAM